MGEYFRLIRTDTARVYTAGDVVHVEVKVYDTDGNLVSPDNVKAYLYNPCGDEVESQFMTETATGVFELNFNKLPDGYKVGKWLLRFEAKQSTTIYNYLESYIVVLPKDSNLISEVRLLAGIDSRKQIDDNELAFIIWNAWYEVAKEIFEEVEETPCSNPTTGALFDGSNKLFKISKPPIADITGDGSVKGYGESSCATDIDGYWIDEDGIYHKLKISNVSDEIGTINITQLDGTAIPSSAKSVKVHYYSQWRFFDKYMFYKAVAYLAAHECLIRLQSLRATTMADVASNERRIIMSPNRMYKEFRRIIKYIRKPQIGAV